MEDTLQHNDIGVGCHVLIAQVQQTINDREISQKENLGGDSGYGTYCSVALVKMLERHVESDELEGGSPSHAIFSK